MYKVIVGFVKIPKNSAQLSFCFPKILSVNRTLYSMYRLMYVKTLVCENTLVCKQPL